MRCRMARLRRTADVQRAAPTDRNQSEADVGAAANITVTVVRYLTGTSAPVA